MVSDLCQTRCVGSGPIRENRFIACYLLKTCFRSKIVLGFLTHLGESYFGELSKKVLVLFISELMGFKRLRPCRSRYRVLSSIVLGLETYLFPSVGHVFQKIPVELQWVCLFSHRGKLVLQFQGIEWKNMGRPQHLTPFSEIRKVFQKVLWNSIQLFMRVIFLRNSNLIPHNGPRLNAKSIILLICMTSK